MCNMAFADRVLSALVLILGTYIVFKARELQYYLDGIPGPGFTPFWVGVTLIGLAVLIFIGSYRGEISKIASPFSKKNILQMLAVIGASLLVAVTTTFLGLLVSLGLLSGYLTWFYGLRRWQSVLLTAVLVPLVLYLVFTVGLDVRFPSGILSI